MKQLWVKVGEKVAGPFDQAKLERLAVSGKLKPTHLVSTDRERWVPAAKVKGLNFPASNEDATPEFGGEAETESSSFLSMKLPPARKAKRRPPPGVEKRPSKKDFLSPLISESENFQAEDSRLEILTKTGKAKQTDLRTIRKLLLSGKLTRHDETRWIEPKPKKSDYRDESDEDEESQKKAYLKAVKEWRTRGEWRPIGEGLAKEEYKIRMLYKPAGVFMELGTAIIGILLFLVVMILFSVRLVQIVGEVGSLDALSELSEAIKPENAVRDPVGFFLTREAIRSTLYSLPLIGLILLVVAGVIGLVGGFLFGGLGGWVIGTCINPLLPKPPKDGYVRKAK